MRTKKVKYTLRRVLALVLVLASVLSMEMITPSANYICTTEQKANNKELDFKLITRACKDLSGRDYTANAAYLTYLNEYIEATKDQRLINTKGWSAQCVFSPIPYGWNAMTDDKPTADGLFFCSAATGRYTSGTKLSETAVQSWGYHALISFNSAANADTGAQSISWNTTDYRDDFMGIYSILYPGLFLVDTYNYFCYDRQTVGACIPFVLEVTVPANSTYEVEYAFDLSGSCTTGDYTMCVLNGDCNKNVADTVTYVTGDILGTGQLEYLNMEADGDVIVSAEHDPQQATNEGNADGAKDGEKLQKTGYKTFTYINNSDHAQKFVRAFAVMVLHGSNWNGQLDNLTYFSHDLDGALNVSVNDIKKSSASVEIRDTATAQAQSTSSWSVEFGSDCGTNADALNYNTYADHTFLRVGDSVDISKVYKKADSSYFAANASVNSSGTAANQSAWFNLTFDEKDTTEQQRLFVIPAKVSVEVPAGAVYSSTFRLDLSGKMSSGYTVGVLDAGGNIASTVTQPEKVLCGTEKLVYGGSNVDTIGKDSTVLNYNPKNQPELAISKSNRLNNLSLLYADRQIDKEFSDIFYKTYIFDNSASKETQTFSRYILLVVSSNRYLPSYVIEQFPLSKNHGFYTRSGSVKLEVKQTSAQKVDLSTKVGADDTEDSVGGNTINWSVKSRDELASILKAVSDCDYHTAVGWERLLMTPSGEKNSTFTGQITNTGTGTVQNDYIHPLGDYLKYAWLYNGAYSYPGAVGIDYLVPEADISTQPLQNCSDFDWDEMASEGGCTTTSDLDAWYIKYAGEVDGKPSFYLAMEGVDGKRYLLVNRFDVVGTGNPEFQQMFVTAAEYDAYPELYATAYGWPTGTKGAKALKSGDESLHTYKGLWQEGKNANGDCNITADGLSDEAFRVSISGNLQWVMDCYPNSGQPNAVYQFTNKIQNDTASLENSTLYQYYKSVDRSSDDADIKRFLEYEPEMKNCIYYLQNTYSDALRCYTPNKSDMSSAHLKSNELLFCDLDLYLGIYEDATKTEDINIGEGQTYVVTGSTHIQEGQKLTVGKGGTLQVKGTLINDGSIHCYGTILIESGGCIRDDLVKPQGFYGLEGGTLIIGTDGIFHPGYSVNYAVQIYRSTIYNDGLFIAPAGLVLSTVDVENGVNGVIVTSGALKKSLSTNSARELAEAMPRSPLPADRTMKKDDDTVVKLVKDILMCYGKANLAIGLERQKKALYNEAFTETDYTQPIFKNKCILRNDGVVYYFGGYDVQGELVAYGTGVSYDFRAIASHYSSDTAASVLWSLPDYGFIAAWGTDNSSNIWYMFPDTDPRKLMALYDTSEYYNCGKENIRMCGSTSMVYAFSGQAACSEWVSAFDAELNGN